MKCSQCHGYGYIDNLEGDGIRCPKCNGVGRITFGKEPEIYTNDEWRKTCSAEEFAKWIYDLIMHEGNTEWYEDLLDYREDTMDYRADYHLIEMWLKEIHKNEV